MKYFVAIALIVAVASAAVIKPTAVSDEMSQVAEIIGAINSPNTDPATAALLEQMLFEILGISPEPIAVGPAIVDAVSPVAVVEATPVGVVDAAEISPIAVGPEIIDFPLPDGGALTEVEAAPVAVSPAGVAPAVVAPAATEESASLVQIIININTAALAGENPVSVAAPEVVATPEAAAEDEIAPTPVSVVESAPIVPEAVSVVDTAPVVPEPVAVVDAIPEPVQVVEPEALEPVAVAEPTLPIAVQPVVLPETLN